RVRPRPSRRVPFAGIIQSRFEGSRAAPRSQESSPHEERGEVYRRQVASATAWTAAGFSSDERSPGSLRRYVARITRRMIFALRVFGRSSVKRTFSGFSA